MILRKLHIKNWRGILGEAHISFDDGLNVISGPNEAGKSTLLEAVRFALSERPDSTSQKLQAIRPKGRGLKPSVTLEFDSRGDSFAVTKRFFEKREHTVLNRLESGKWQPIAEDRPACERLEEILKKDGLLGQALKLWADQGQAGEILEKGAPELKERLSALLAGLLITDADRAVISSVETQWLSRFTKKERAPITGSEWQKTIQEARHAREELAAARGEEERHKAASSQADAVEEKLAAARTAEAAELELLASARGRKSGWDEYRRLAAEAQAANERSSAFLRAKRQWDASIESLVQTEAASQLAKEALAPAEKAREAARVEVEKTRQELISLTTQEELLALQQRYVFLLCARIDLDKIAGMKKDEPLAPSAGEWAGLQVTHQEVERRRLQLDSMGLKLSIELERAASGRIAVDGGKPEDFKVQAGMEMRWMSAESLALGIDGIGKLRVETGMKDAVRLKQELVARMAALAKGICPWEPVSPDATVEALNAAWDRLTYRYQSAEDMRLERKTLEASAKALYRDLDILRVRQKIEDMERKGGIPAGLAVVARDELNSLATALSIQVTENTAKLKAERARADALAAELRSKEAAAASSSQKVGDLLARKRAEISNLMQARQAMAALDPGIAGSGAEPATDGFDAQAERNSQLYLSAAAACVGAAARASAASEAAIAKRPSGNEVNDAEIALLETRAARCQESTKALSAELNQLIGQVKTSGNGLFEKVNLLEERVSALTSLEKTLQDEAYAWDLMRSILDEERQAMVDTVIEPVCSKMGPWLARLTGGRYSRVELDRRDLRPLELKGDGVSLAIDGEVSWGTSEQVAFLARLALASLLKENGERQVLVLDDPLVNTDAARQESAWQILLEAANDIQLLILTCHAVPAAISGLAHVIAMPPQ